MQKVHNLCVFWRKTRNEIRKTWRLSMVFVLFLVSLTSVAQGQEQTVTLNLKQATLYELFDAIRKQTDLRFLYNAATIDHFPAVNVVAKNKKVKDVLTEVFQGSQLSFSFDRNVVTVVRKAVKSGEKFILTGFVYDEKKHPMPGVTVRIMGTTIGTATDTRGWFQFILPEAAGILEFSFVGYESQQVKITPSMKDTLRIYLKEDIVAMDEVNVISTGYQTVNRRDMVGSFSQVKVDDIKIPGVMNVMDMLQGQIPGMIVTRSSARAGSSPKIKIRGTTTFGNTDPLFVVDGIIQDDPIQMNASVGQIDDMTTIIGDQISWLNPNDIETITVLKDASATAIYGSRASNGVIVITTKKPKSGERISVNYSGSLSIAPRPRYSQFNLMNSQERVVLSEEAFAAGVKYRSEPIPDMHTYEGTMRLFFDKQISAEDFMRQKDYLESVNTDWLELLTRTALTHSHGVSIGGASTNTTYTVSLNYNKQEGQEIGNSSERYTARVAVNMRLRENMRLAASLDGSMGENLGFANGVNPMTYATTTSRAIPAYEADGSLAYYLQLSTYPYNKENKYLSYNIINERDNSESSVKNGRVGISLNFSWDLFSWLRYELTGGYTYNTVTTDRYSTERTFYVANKYRGYDYGTVESTDPWYAAAQLPYGGELFSSMATQKSYNIQNKILFNKTFNEDNRINVMLGTEVRSAQEHNTQTTFWGYVPDRGHMFAGPTLPEKLVPIGAAGPSGFGIYSPLANQGAKIGKSTNNFFSIFATLAYSFKNRYVLNANFRNDASNRFGQDVNKRFDPTYSFGLSWRVSEEPWMQAISKVVTDMNFKVTYGIQGNADLNTSPDLILTMGGLSNLFGSYISNITSIPNPNLSWERTKTWNFGVDMRLFNRFNVVVDYYTRASDALIDQEIPHVNGWDRLKVNGGRIYNRGIEGTVSFNPVVTKDFGINISLNSSKNWNEGGKTTLDNITYQHFLNGSSSTILKEGYSLSSIWSWSFKGLNPENGLPEFDKLDVEREIAEADPTTVLEYSGETEPNFTGGMNLGIRYKAVSLSTSLALLLGGVTRLPSPYKDFAYGSMLPDATINLPRDLNNRWKKPGDEKFTTIPSLQSTPPNVVLPFYGTSGNLISEMYPYSSELVVKSSFLRCSNLSVSWRMNTELAKKLRINSCSVSASVSNLFVIASKRFNGFDPELKDSVQPKNYSISLNIGF